jgi:hypothetical protein
VLDFDAVFEQIVADALARHGVDDRAVWTQFDVRQHNDLRHTNSVLVCEARTPPFRHRTILLVARPFLARAA